MKFKSLVLSVLAFALCACDMTDDQKKYNVPTDSTNIKIIRDNSTYGELTFDHNGKSYRAWWYGTNSWIIEESNK